MTEEFVDPLSPEMLRWHCDPSSLDFSSTAEVEPTVGIIGQPMAMEALEFALDCTAPGQNVFVRGLRGSGRMGMIRRLLDEIAPGCRIRLDRCYVHNFLQPDRPRLISLPRGQARQVRKRLRNLSEFVAEGLVDAMNSEPLQASRNALQAKAQVEVDALTKPLEEELHEEGLALVPIKSKNGTQAALFPIWESQPIPPEQFMQMVADGKISEAEKVAYEEKLEKYSSRLPELTQGIGRIMREGSREVEEFNEKQVRRLVGDITEQIKRDFNNEALAAFLDEVVDDVVENMISGVTKGYDPHERYGINILLERVGEACPVVVETNPSLANLLGGIETQWNREGRSRSDYRSVRAGSLLMADGGYLILDCSDVLAENGAWRILMRTLRTGVLEIVPAELDGNNNSLKPEPIPVDLRVVLLGNSGHYYRLDRLDPDFSEQFKVLADFSPVIDNTPEAVMQYAGVLSRIAREEGLRHFTVDAVASLAEHGARIAANGRKLTTWFGRIADIAREADWLAGKANADLVDGTHVMDAIRRTKSRASLPSKRFYRMIQDETIRIETQGERVGQINGLAVMHAGPLAYGFPARITATIAAGTAGVIDIESKSAMSGSIHTKGFHILGGLLRHLLRPDHPLVFSASIAFEQSYGGIDGDSASGAEVCCLLSALTGIPLRQDLAMTGAIDQHGSIQAIGGANEKIEGFFDVCDHFGLTGTQGVVIPASNADDLMLRQDVVEAARAGKFSVYAVETIHEALALFANRKVGQWDAGYSANTLLGIARIRAREFWEETAQQPVIG